MTWRIGVHGCDRGDEGTKKGGNGALVITCWGHLPFWLARASLVG